MKRFFLFIFCIAALVGGWRYYKWAKGVPDVAFLDPQGHAVRLSELRGDKQYLNVTFLIPNCAFSRHSLSVVKKEADAHPTVAFAGLLMGADSNSAEAYRKENGLTFPVYGTASDPAAHNALVESIGTWRGIWGGTVLLVDERQRVVAKVEKEQVNDLPQVLAKVDPI